jgi:hypothetical protein
VAAEYAEVKQAKAKSRSVDHVDRFWLKKTGWQIGQKVLKKW